MVLLVRQPLASPSFLAGQPVARLTQQLREIQKKQLGYEWTSPHFWTALPQPAIFVLATPYFYAQIRKN